jgi:hypothetical protein
MGATTTTCDGTQPHRSPRFRVAGLAALVLGTVTELLGCEKARGGDLFCAQKLDRKSASTPGQGLNPLLGEGRYTCFVDRPSCERESSGCVASGPPTWHCFGIAARHGTAATAVTEFDTECMPTRETCESTRASLPAEELNTTPCAPDEEVFCKELGGRAIMCHADLAGCEKYSDLLANATRTGCRRR